MKRKTLLQQVVQENTNRSLNNKNLLQPSKGLQEDLLKHYSDEKLFHLDNQITGYAPELVWISNF